MDCSYQHPPIVVSCIVIRLMTFATYMCLSVGWFYSSVMYFDTYDYESICDNIGAILLTLSLILKLRAHHVIDILY